MNPHLTQRGHAATQPANVAASSCKQLDYIAHMYIVVRNVLAKRWTLIQHPATVLVKMTDDAADAACHDSGMVISKTYNASGVVKHSPVGVHGVRSDLDACHKLHST